MVRERLGKHNSCIRHPANDNSCRILSDHFNEGYCRGATFSVNIIEKLPGDGRDENGKIDPTITNLRRKKEKDWMLALRMVYLHVMDLIVGLAMNINPSTTAATYSHDFHH